MKREIFQRAVRMTHKFGATEKRDDPLGTRTFDPGFPVFPTQRSAPITQRRQGECEYRPAPSAVQKPGGRFASKSGPAPDYAEMVAASVPASTKKRTTYKPT